MFDTGMPGLRRAMAVFSVPDDLAVFNFDDAANLQRVGMRPSDVVIRNKAVTQRRAASLFEERNADGSHRWQGLHGGRTTIRSGPISCSGRPGTPRRR